MHDATFGVGAAPGPAPGAGEPARPSAVDSANPMPEIELDGRLWEAPEALEDYEPVRFVPPDDHETAQLDAELARFAQVDWETWAASDPAAAAQAWEAYEALAAVRAEGAFPGDAESDSDRTARLAAAEAELARDIEGWSPQMAAELARFGRAKGFTDEELAGVEDPREVKVLHLAMLGEQAMAARAFGRFRPPVQLGGGGWGGAAPSDRQSTKAWMQARQSQLRKKARG